ncbi:hypothetical protein ACFPYJ_29780 [Paenibacillus solisilvae]|uniref:Uncharacterized protein n=1 Tax=Paenibacillus solisilvae TaxID=2486751 RepID=A0ABW0W962_9BACL
MAGYELIVVIITLCFFTLLSWKEINKKRKEKAVILFLFFFTLGLSILSFITKIPGPTYWVEWIITGHKPK